MALIKFKTQNGFERTSFSEQTTLGQLKEFIEKEYDKFNFKLVIELKEKITDVDPLVYTLEGEICKSYHGIPDKFDAILQWGNYQYKNREFKLSNKKFTIVAVDAPDLTYVRDLSCAFENSEFSGNLNGWDVSEVTHMYSMFYKSKFNGNIDKWDVSNVIDMCYMFAFSNFNNDISEWNVSSVENMSYMFYKSIFNGNISKWNVSKLKHMSYMFVNSKFDGHISDWDVSNVINIDNIFEIK